MSDFKEVVMPTIGEVYKPLVEIGLRGSKDEAAAAIRKAGELIFKHNPGVCPSVEDGIEAAKRNLDYFCQYYDEKTAAAVKRTFGLGAGMRLLTGQKLP
jgi:hypothetical protein